MDPIHYLAVIQRLLFGFQLLAPGFKHDNAKLGFNELQRERYPRGTGADNAQITFQLRAGRNRRESVIIQVDPTARIASFK
jgi:hypothetical protein